MNKSTELLIEEALSLSEKDIKKTWEFVGKGAFKEVYRKQNIVVKLSIYKINSHLLQEYKLYHHLKKGHRKYFAKSYAYRKVAGYGRLIQAYVPGKTRYFTERQRKFLKNLGQIYGLIDLYEENVKFLKRRPIIIDYGI